MLSSIVSPLDGFRSPFGPQRGFNPARLFGTTDTGWFYDLYDWATLFQDAAGTTPVTAVGQPVGLQLDKSKGLVLGPELLPNSFSSGTWTSLAAGVSIASGVVTFSNVPAGANGLLLSAINGSPYQANKSFEVVLTISGYVSGGLRVWTGAGYTQVYSANGAFTFRVYYPADQSIRVYTPVTGADTSLSATISVRELPGNHRSQSVSLNRPTLRQDTNGLYYLEYDGLNDHLSTAPFAWGSDKATICAGVRKLSDAAVGMLAEASVNINTNTGAFRLTAPATVGPSYSFGSRGSGAVIADAIISSGFAAPVTNVITGIGDISGDVSRLRVNGTQVASSTQDQGTGNYGTHPVFFGARAGTSLFSRGWEYSNVGINRLLTANELAALESWTAGKAGNTL